MAVQIRPPSAVPDPSLFSSDTDAKTLNQFNQWMRGQGWWQNFIATTQKKGKGNLTDQERGQLATALQQNGMLAKGIKVDQAGNLHTMSWDERHPDLLKGLEAAGMAAGSIFGAPALAGVLAPSIGATAANIAAPVAINAAESGIQGKAPSLTSLAASAVPGGVAAVTPGLTNAASSALTNAIGPTGARIATPLVTTTLAKAATGQAPTLTDLLLAAGTGAAKTYLPTPPTRTPGIASLTGGPSGGGGNALGLTPGDVGTFGAPAPGDVFGGPSPTPTPTTTTDVFQSLFGPGDQSQFQMPGVTPDVAPPATLGGTFTPPASLGTPFDTTADPTGTAGSPFDQITPLQYQGPQQPTAGGGGVPWYTQLVNALTGKGGQGGQSLLNAAISAALQYAAASKTAGAQTQAAQTSARASLLGAQLNAQTAANAQALQAALAQGDVATANAIQQGNYGQWKAREQRLSNFGQLLGLPARQIPDYVPIPPLNLPNLPAPSLANLTVPNNLQTLLGGG
jgi:hypothetical protein